VVIRPLATVREADILDHASAAANRFVSVRFKTSLDVESWSTERRLRIL